MQIMAADYRLHAEWREMVIDLHGAKKQKRF